MAALALWLAAAADARPGQTVVDGSDPQGKTRSEPLLSEEHQGGEVPVRLVYDESKGGDDEEGKRAAREAEEGGRAPKLLSLAERENDENAAYGLNVQSRSKAEHREGGEEEGEKDEELMKPFVYNIQPLSYYSTETKEQENIINYINRIKEMRENQIKWEAAKEEARPAEKQEDSVVTEAQTPEGPIRRRIQHVQIVLGPVAGAQDRPQAYGYESAPHQAFYPAPVYQHPYGHPPGELFYRQPAPRPSVVYVPNVFGPAPASASTSTKGYLDYVNPNYWFNQYFPIVVNNPFEAMQLALSSIVEYGPEADVCRSAKAGAAEARRFGIGGGGVKKEEGDWPRLARVKVRRGGVAIAGPGGIATAGSGGTAIVGPGGTAYTTRGGTAVVGPGGRVVHVPRFPLYADGVDDGFEPPAGAETVADGPVVYIDDAAAAAAAPKSDS